MNIGFKKLHPDAIPFKYTREGDACMDMFSLEQTELYANIPTLIKTGIAVEIPEGYEGIVRGRSGYALHHGIWVHVGTIDASYRGDIGIIAIWIPKKDSDKDSHIIIAPDMRIAQFSIHPVTHIHMIERELTKTQRGSNGYGSSGY